MDGDGGHLEQTVMHSEGNFRFDGGSGNAVIVQARLYCTRLQVICLCFSHTSGYRGREHDPQGSTYARTLPLCAIPLWPHRRVYPVTSLAQRQGLRQNRFGSGMMAKLCDGHLHVGHVGLGRFDNRKDSQRDCHLFFSFGQV